MGSKAQIGQTHGNLGARLRELRKKMGLSLNELANSAGIARSTLYKVENSGMSLTYDKLISLSAGLGVEVAALFQPSGRAAEPIPVTGRREIGRQGQGDGVETQNYDYVYLCNELVQKNLVPMLGRVKSRTMEEYGELVGHPGEEFTYVLKGSIEVVTTIYRPAVLNEGDFVYLDSTMPHAFLCRSEEDALVLTVCSSPDNRHQASHGTPHSSLPKLEKQQMRVVTRAGARKVPRKVLK